MRSATEKDVEQQLLSGRRRARNSGIPYPIRHDINILNFDIWNNMFLNKCCKSLTMYQFQSPPQMVLDLGCGSGQWVLEAAKQWPDSAFVGFDMLHIQPNLSGFDAHMQLAKRIKWIHGNLLDGLSFSSSDHFDFVRVVNIGLGVPEDEWQTVLEEVSRVMKPGAVLEIIEEDLIFPCLPFVRNRPRPPPIAVNLPRSDSLPSSSASVRTSATLPISDQWPTSHEESFDSAQVKKSLLSPELPWPTSISSLILPELEEEPDVEHETHPQDHSRLQASWNAMLSRRFLNSSVITVLPFYLSTCFGDVQSHPPLHVPLPPSSSQSLNRSSADTHWYNADDQFSLAPYSGRKSNDSAKFASQHNKQVQDSTSQCMHLAKAVSMVIACKEAIWDEYETLYGAELPPVTRTARPSEAKSQASKSSAREGFDRAWSNWESDMKDRMGFRHHIETKLCWEEPPGDRPDWRIWKDNVGMHPVKKDNASSKSKTEPPCRSMRGFVARKPS